MMTEQKWHFGEWKIKSMNIMQNNEKKVDKIVHIFRCHFSANLCSWQSLVSRQTYLKSLIFMLAFYSFGISNISPWRREDTQPSQYSRIESLPTHCLAMCHTTPLHCTMCTVCCVCTKQWQLISRWRWQIEFQVQCDLKKYEQGNRNVFWNRKCFVHSGVYTSQFTHAYICDCVEKSLAWQHFCCIFSMISFVFFLVWRVVSIEYRESR